MQRNTMSIIVLCGLYRVLEALETFAKKIRLENSSSTFTEDRLHLLVAEMRASNYSGYFYMSDLSEETESSLKEDPQVTPLMEASIQLPESLLQQLSIGGPDDKTMLRVISFTLTEDTLFVFDDNSTVAKAIANEDLTLGNIFIAASLSISEVVENLEDPIEIRFIQTEVK